MDTGDLLRMLGKMCHLLFVKIIPRPKKLIGMFISNDMLFPLNTENLPKKI